MAPAASWCRSRGTLASAGGLLLLLALARPARAIWPFDDGYEYDDEGLRYDYDYEVDDDLELPMRAADGGLDFTNFNEISPTFDVSEAIGKLNVETGKIRFPAPNELPLSPPDESSLPQPPETWKEDLSGSVPKVGVPPGVGLPPGGVSVPSVGIPPVDPGSFDPSKFYPPPGQRIEPPPGAGDAARDAAEDSAAALWPVSQELFNAAFPNATSDAEAAGQERLNATQWWVEREARGQYDERMPGDPWWLQELQNNGTLFGEGSGSEDRFDNFTARDYALFVGAPVVVLETSFRKAANSAALANKTAIEFIQDAEYNAIKFVEDANKTAADLQTQVNNFLADVEAKRQELVWFAANCTAPTVNNCSNVVEIIDGELERYNVGYNTSDLVNRTTDAINQAELERQKLMRSGGLLACCNPNPTHFLRYAYTEQAENAKKKPDPPGFSPIFDETGSPAPWVNTLRNASKYKWNKISIAGHDVISQKGAIWRREESMGGACAPMFQCIPCSITNNGQTAKLCPAEITDPNSPFARTAQDLGTVGQGEGCAGICMPCMLGDFCPGGTVNTFAHTLASACPDGHYCPPLGMNITLPGKPSAARRRALEEAGPEATKDELLGEDALELSSREGAPARRALADEPGSPPPPSSFSEDQAWLVPCPQGQICPPGMPVLMEQTSCQSQLIKGIKKAMKHRDQLFNITADESSGYYCPAGHSGYGGIKSPDNAFRSCPKGSFCENAEKVEKCPDGKFCRKRSSTGTECPWSSDCSGEGNISPSPAWGQTFAVFVLLLILYYWYRRTVSAIERVQKRADERFELDHTNKISTGSAEGILDNVEGADGDATPNSPSPEDATKFLKCKAPVTIEFFSIDLIVGEKQILSHVTGSFEQGEMTALMGPSGCGKSSLMNVICGRASYGKVTGKVLVNDTEVLPGTVGGAPLGYVPQEDTVYGDLTVRENLEFSAFLRLPADQKNFEWTDRKKDAMVNNVLEMIGLAHIKHSLVGDVKKRGISGGQKKRVNVGVEMVTDPTLLFLDEPTSGLGATDTLELMGALANVAKTGRTVAAVIHQPRFQVFLMFHKLFLLGRGGQSIFVGPTGMAQEYFGKVLGFECPDKENPADFFMDCVGGLAMNHENRVPTLDELFATWRSTEEQGLEKALGGTRPRAPNRRPSSARASLVEAKGMLGRIRSTNESTRSQDGAEPSSPYLEMNVSFGQAHPVVEMLSGAPPLRPRHAFGADPEDASGPVMESSNGGVPTQESNAKEMDNNMVAMLWSGVMPKRGAGGRDIDESPPSNEAGASGSGEPAVPMNEGDPAVSTVFKQKPKPKRDLSKSVIKPRVSPKWNVQLKWMLIRLVEQKVRAFSSLIGRMLSLCMAGLAVGIFMSSDYQVYDPRDDKLAMVAVMMSAIGSCFASVSSCNFFAADGPMRKREDLSGVSTTMSYLSRILIDIIEHCWASAFFLGMSYNFVLPEMPFPTFWVIMVSGSYAAGGIGILASEAVAEANQALVSTMSSLVSCIFVNGIIGLRYNDVKALGATWFWAMSPGRWMVEGILVGELRVHTDKAYQELIIRTTLGDTGLGFYPRWSTEKNFERWLWKQNIGARTIWDEATPAQKQAYAKEKYDHWKRYLDNVVLTSCLSLFLIGTSLRVLALLVRMYTPLAGAMWKGFTSFFPASSRWVAAKAAALSAWFVTVANSSGARNFVRGKWVEERIIKSLKRWIRFLATTPVAQYPRAFWCWVTGKPFHDATREGSAWPSDERGNESGTGGKAASAEV